MQMAVHFTGPVLFAGKDGQRKWFADLSVSTNPDYLVYMDDFTGIAINGTNDWTILKDTDASVEIAADVVNGALTMSSDPTTDNDGSSIQGNEIFAVLAGRDIWFETKLTPTDAEGDALEICAGLTVNFATNPEAMLTAADRIVFQVDDGNSNILCKTEKNGTETSTDSGVDIVSATAVILGIHVKGTGAVEFFVNRNLVAAHTTNIPDDENLTTAVMQLSGSATGTKSIEVDYVFAAQTR
jgi:hypothetical protein